MNEKVEAIRERLHLWDKRYSPTHGGDAMKLLYIIAADAIALAEAEPVQSAPSEKDTYAPNDQDARKVKAICGCNLAIPGERNTALEIMAGYRAEIEAALRTKLAELTKIRDKGRALLLVLEDGLKQYDDCDLGQMFTGDWDGDELGIPMSELRAALDGKEK